MVKSVQCHQCSGSVWCWMECHDHDLCTLYTFAISIYLSSGYVLSCKSRFNKALKGDHKSILLTLPDKGKWFWYPLQITMEKSLHPPQGLHWYAPVQKYSWESSCNWSHHCMSKFRIIHSPQSFWVCEFNWGVIGASFMSFMTPVPCGMWFTILIGRWRPKTFQWAFPIPWIPLFGQRANMRTLSVS